MTEPKRWPQNAREARDRSAELALQGTRLLRPVVRRERQFTQLELVHRQAAVLDYLNQIVLLMTECGAPVQTVRRGMEQ